MVKIKKISLVVSGVLFSLQTLSSTAIAESMEERVCAPIKNRANNLICEIAAIRVGAQKIADVGRTSVSHRKPSTIGAYCKNAVLKTLKSPGSAKFLKAPKIVEFAPGLYSVEGEVDAQNGYGALLRGEYYCYYHNNPKYGLGLLDFDIETRT